MQNIMFLTAVAIVFQGQVVEYGRGKGREMMAGGCVITYNQMNITSLGYMLPGSVFVCDLLFVY